MWPVFDLQIMGNRQLITCDKVVSNLIEIITPLQEITYDNEITLCFLGPGSGDFPAFTPSRN